MKTILAHKLFEDKHFLNSIEIDTGKHLTIDFSKVKEFNLNNLHTLMDLQKLALFNDVKLDIKNTTPIIDKFLSETGLYKTFANTTTNLATKRFNFS